jgi:predicted PurR-regulated permease PerM
MNRAVGLSPIVIMLAMMIGAQYLGILGLVLAIPIATTVAIFVKDYASRTK